MKKYIYIFISGLFFAGFGSEALAQGSSEIVPQNGTYTDSATSQVELSLEDCKTMALQNSMEVVNSRLDVLAAKEQKGEAFAEYFPTVSVAGFGYHALNPLLEIGVQDIIGAGVVTDVVNGVAPLLGIDPVWKGLHYGWSGSLMATLPIYAGGRIVNGNKLATLAVTAAELKSSLQERKSVEEVEADYWQVVSLTEKAKTIEVVQELLDTLQKDLRSAVEAGLAVETDMLEVNLRRNELAAKRSQLQGAITLAKMNLFNAIGFPYTPYIMNASDSLPYVNNVVLTDAMDLREPSAYWKDENELLASREESQLLGLNVEAKKYEKRMTRGEVLPQLGVGGTYGYGRLALHGNWNGVLFATLNIPISDWGKYSKKIKRYDYELQKARNEMNSLNDKLVLQIRMLWLNVTVSWDQTKIAEEGVAMAQTSVEQLTESYKAGLIPLSELLKAQSVLQQNADELTDARIAYLTALSSYLNVSPAE